MRLVNRIQRYIARRNLGRNPEEKIKRLREISAHAESIERIVSSDSWKDFDERRQVYQRIREYQMRSLSVTDQERMKAVIEWNCLDEFFRELKSVIREGQKARESLKHINSPPLTQAEKSPEAHREKEIKI